MRATARPSRTIPSQMSARDYHDPKRTHDLSEISDDIKLTKDHPHDRHAELQEGIRTKLGLKLKREGRQYTYISDYEPNTHEIDEARREKLKKYNDAAKELRETDKLAGLKYKLTRLNTNLGYAKFANTRARLEREIVEVKAAIKQEEERATATASS